jgi:hypothetical protein
MAKGKKQRFFTMAGSVHYLIYTLSVMLTLWLACGNRVSALLYIVTFLIVLLSHWCIDATDVVRGWMSMLRQTDISIVRIMVDQSFHLIILTIVALLVEPSCGGG